MDVRFQSTSASDPIDWAEKFASLGTFDLVLLACLLAAAIYFAFEGFFSDFTSSEMTYSSGRVVSEDSGFGEDFKRYTVEFTTVSGELQLIKKVSHPLRSLSVGEPVSVRYPVAAPEKGEVRFSMASSGLMKITQVGGMLFLAYIILKNA
ncbi:hypothetical protein FGU71_03450 [Erythrobacter insulae]|uniref:DUF3592 domain-containing protein n=1 Tax=Erythrobacter insulae TaxID=2584124 RepID=A0A547PA32_9SPHN|nr:DUF3592 domain-containing protein [Erythrobacter insulae]TRD10998.1 hypothetical protein FGU71_03450 [Erythrobacter insulae]